MNADQTPIIILFNAMRRYGGVWTTALGVLCLSGCSPYQEVQIRTDAKLSEVGEVAVETVAVGDAVRVTTFDGVRHSGTIASCSMDLLVMYIKGENANERREFTSREIAKLEIRTDSGAGGIVLIGAIALIIWIASRSAGIGFS